MEDDTTWVQIEVTDVTGPDDFVVVTIEDKRETPGKPNNLVVRQPHEHPYLCAVEQVRVDELVSAVRASCGGGSATPDGGEEDVRGVLHQFRIDFPRCRVTLQGHLQDSADVFWTRVHEILPYHVARNVLVLCTQGALADVYSSVMRYLVRSPDTHVVDAGHYEISVDLMDARDTDDDEGGSSVSSTCKAKMRVSKRFQLVRIEECAHKLAEVRVELRLELSATLSSGNQIIEAFETSPSSSAS